MNDYHFFWGGPFSNWYKAPFVHLGTEYNCVEQFMMAHKALMFKDYEIHKDIMLTDDPRKQKKYGRKVKNFNPNVWDICKRRIVETGCELKFYTNKDLRDLMLNMSAEVRLVEASPYDRIWGIGYSEAEALDNIDNWGEDLLGKILTEIKNKIKRY